MSSRSDRGFVRVRHTVRATRERVGGRASVPYDCPNSRDLVGDDIVLLGFDDLKRAVRHPSGAVHRVHAVKNLFRAPEGRAHAARLVERRAIVSRRSIDVDIVRSRRVRV